MTIQNLPFISVQADWDEVVREVDSNTIPEGSFWIACYLTGIFFLNTKLFNKKVLFFFFNMI